MPIPLLNFQPYNPMDNAIKTAMGVYGGLNQGAQQNLQNQALEERMPYIAPEAEQALQRAMKENEMYEEIKRSEMERSKVLNEKDRFKLDNPTLGAGGPQGILAAYDFEKSQGNPNADLLLKELNRTASGMRNNAQLFRSYPMDVKRGIIAQYVGLGLSQAEAAQKAAEGYTPEDVANELGISPESVGEYGSVYNPTQPNITASKNREVAGVELRYLQPKINEALGDYQSKMPIYGFSPEQAVDIALGLNKDKQAAFMAAQMAIPELLTLRARAVGAEVSHAQYKELEDKSIGIKKAFEYGMDKDTFVAANNMLNEWLYGASDEANKEMYSPAQANKAKRKEMEQSIQKGMAKAKPLSEMSDEELEKAFSEISGGM